MAERGRSINDEREYLDLRQLLHKVDEYCDGGMEVHGEMLSIAQKSSSLEIFEYHGPSHVDGGVTHDVQSKGEPICESCYVKPKNTVMETTMTRCLSSTETSHSFFKKIRRHHGNIMVPFA
ncbi:uncharacterized protein LOC124140067 isoform X2 [Haliotis rufescens]|uniref:uncharacterized protein LOC124140067 isoform X2 n=1 Tax=Haliotis rufescens TaxID=6454 RepID=UPI00201EDD75|nr:uncharacterized protein LOC124140067 isoform X2 [Haliotis rufescens]